MKRDVIVTCAVTGGADHKGRNPNLPITADEIADDIAAVADAGAAMVHIHARNPVTTRESWAVKDFVNIVDAVRARGTDILINLTSAIGVVPVDPNGDACPIWSAEERMAHIRAAGPDICSLDVPIMNYHDIAYINAPDVVRHIAQEARKIGVKPEIECFSPADVWRTRDYIAEGLFEDPPLIQLCMGIKYGAPATVIGMLSMLDELPDPCSWGAFSIGPQQMPMVAQSVLMGGNVRVGLEDNLFLQKDVPASNVSLVQRAVEIIERLGSNVASVASAREQLGLT